MHGITPIAHKCYAIPIADLGVPPLVRVRPCRDVFVRNLSDRLMVWGAQAKLARHLGRSQSAVSNWRKGKRDPSFEELDAIADFFNIPVAELFNDPTDSRNTKGQTLSHQQALDLLKELLPKPD